MVGSPSTELAVKMSAEEKERVAEQMERLGEAGMKQKADELEKAIEQNEVHSHTQFRRENNDCMFWEDFR